MTRRDRATITFDPGTDAARSRMDRWLADPVIARWCHANGDEPNVGEWSDDRASATALIVSIDGRPAGWCRHFAVAEAAVDGVADRAEVRDTGGFVGLEFALGADHRGQRYGPLVVDAWFDHVLTADHRLDGAITRMPAVNAVAIATVRRAGFTVVGSPPAHRESDATTMTVHRRRRGEPSLRSSLAATFEWFDHHSGWAPPATETISEWVADHIGRAPDDCWTTTHGACRHGLATWATVLRYAD